MSLDWPDSAHGSSVHVVYYEVQGLGQHRRNDLEDSEADGKGDYVIPKSLFPSRDESLFKVVVTSENQPLDKTFVHVYEVLLSHYRSPNPDGVVTERLFYRAKGAIFRTWYNWNSRVNKVKYHRLFGGPTRKKTLHGGR